MTNEFGEFGFLGEGARRICSAVSAVASQLESREYQFQADEEFAGLLRRDIGKGMRVYWEEQMQHFHWVCVSSLLRNWRWIQGAETARESQNVLAFAACLRNLVESVADCYLVFSVVPLTIAGNAIGIRTGLRGEMKEPMISQEIENQLVHFTYASRVARREREDAGPLAALETWQYLDRLVPVTGARVKELYGELCEFTHPAKRSSSWMYAWEGLRVRGPVLRDAEEIARIAKEFEAEITATVEAGFNGPLVGLKVLNEFDYQAIRTSAMDAVNLDSVSAWTKAFKALRSGNIP